MKKYLNLNLIELIISTLLFIIAQFISNNHLLLIISYLIITYKIYIISIKQLLNKNIFNEYTLMILASLGAFYIGEYNEAVIVMILYSLGEYLSDLAVEKSKESIISLMDLRVEKVHLVKGEKIKDVKLKDVKVNDIYKLFLGERVPLDGVILEGKSLLDTAPITGESIPKVVHENDKVLSGCINKDSLLTIKAESTHATTTTTKILKLLEDSNKTSSKTEKFITKFASIYTPIVVLCALILIIFPTILTGSNINIWLYRGLVFLVASCPCALVISVPLGYFCGLGVSSRNGAIIKGSNVLDDLCNIDYLLLDKTGTITEGVFEITKIKTKNIEEKEFLKTVASAEVYSNHPIAKVVKDKWNDNLYSITNFKEISGKGITCKINNKDIILGNKKLLSEYNIECEEVSYAGSIIYLSINKEYKGYMIISDKIKDCNLDLSKLKSVVNKDIIILSGDSKNVVESISKKLKIKNFYSELLPEEKVEKLNYYNNLGSTMFVGDGINDAPALVKAKVGVSIGNISSDAALEASDVVLMNDNLNTIAKIVKISKKTKEKVKQCIVFALAVKFIILLLSCFGLSSIWLAVFADVGTTLLSVLYILTLSLKKY